MVIWAASILVGRGVGEGILMFVGGGLDEWEFECWFGCGDWM